MININIDDDSLNGAVLDVVDSLTVHGLKQAREGLITDYENNRSGHYINAFVVDDPEEDAFEISRRIEAFDLVLDYLTFNHTPYEFNDERN